MARMAQVGFRLECLDSAVQAQAPLPAGMSLNEYGDWIHETALKNNVTFLDGIGFAPGLSNITCGEGIRKLEAEGP